MSLLDVIRYRLRATFAPSLREKDMADELRHHLDLEAMQAQASAHGELSDDEARRRAHRTFGNTTWYNEERRMISRIGALDTARQDVWFLLRLLRRRAAFTTVAVTTIAIGIGATTSIYSVADAVLFRPLPFPDADRLAVVWLNRPKWKEIADVAKRWDRGPLSLPIYRDWRAGQRTFSDVAVWKSALAMAGEPGAAEEVTVARASASLFNVLGIHPEIGAWFADADDVVGGAPVTVLGHEIWTQQFGGDPHIIGRLLPIGSTSYRVIGVAPRGLSLDRGSSVVAYWIPAGADAKDANDRESTSYSALGRLAPTASLATAAAESNWFFAKTAGDARVEGATVRSLHDDQTRIVRTPLLILLAAAGLLLLIACLNVATLLLGEVSRRESELRTRAALGAGWSRLLRQLITENMVLAGAGAIAGTGLAYVATQLIVRAAPASTPGLRDVHVNLRVLVVSLIVAIGTGLLFGLAPALSLARSSQTLGHAGAKHTARGQGRGQRGLIACEVALSIVLLVGAGLLVRSFSRLSSVGFDPSELVVVSLRLPRPPFEDSVHVRSLYETVIQRLSRMPGVQDAAATTTPPFSGGASSGSFEVEGHATGANAQRRSTTPDFFRTAGIPIIEGRSYTALDREGTLPVVVVSRALARGEWPRESSLGKRIKFGGQWYTVVGVAGDIATERPTTDPVETVYLPLSQAMLRGTPALLVRMRPGTPLKETTRAIRQTVRDVEADVAVTRVVEMRDAMAASLADDRLRTVLITLFAAIAAVLAAVGMYGVAAAAADRRTREMAIRVALGASGASITRLIVGGTASGVVVGGVAGAGLALAGTRVLSPYLYGIHATDPTVYITVGLLLTLTTIGATWYPARRATQVRVIDTLSAD